MFISKGYWRTAMPSNSDTFLDFIILQGEVTIFDLRLFCYQVAFDEKTKNEKIQQLKQFNEKFIRYMDLNSPWKQKLENRETIV